ncbi:MAG TPA: septum formation initiator family protein [Actinomycetota bacterium]
MTDQQPRPRSLLSPRGFVLLLVIGGLMFSSVYPLRRYIAVRHGIEQLTAEDRALRDRIDELLAEREELLSDAEVERLARSGLGMVRPGEVPFVIAAPRDPVPEPDEVDPAGFAPPVDEGSPGLLERWWDAMRVAVGT